MRSGKWVLLSLWLVLLGLISGCCITSPPNSVLSIRIDARETARCDDGIKVVVEGIQEDWEFGEPFVGMDARDSGPNWVWVEPGHTGVLQWDVGSSISPAVKQPQGKLITVKAYCMRQNAEPGLSQREFELKDYVQTACNNVLKMRVQVHDSGADPIYTVTPPGLTIEANSW